MNKNTKKIGLVLGSGSARGMSHIGVIRALEKMGITPDIVVGCSVGSLVGASYLFGKLDALEEWASAFNKRTIASYFDLNFSMRGFVKQERMQDFYEEYVCSGDVLISQMPKPFAAVACDLSSGEEIWLKSGNVIDALWASMSYPGLYPAFRHQDRWLVDGGLVNPVPVSIAKSMGADVIIAVNLNSDISKIHELTGKTDEDDEPINLNKTFIGKAKKSIQSVTPGWLSSNSKNESQQPKMFDVLTTSIDIMQDRITRSQLVGDPPDVVLAPRLSHIGLLELHKAAEAIKEGEACVNRMAEEIEYRINR